MNSHDTKFEVAPWEKFKSIVNINTIDTPVQNKKSWRNHYCLGDNRYNG